MKAFDKLCKMIDMVLSVVTVAIMIFLTVLITVNVISRFVFNSPIAWQYEGTLVCMSWVVFLGMAITFGQDEHMRLTFVCDAIPEKYRAYFYAVLDLFVILFLAAGFYFSLAVTKNAFQTYYQTLPSVSKGWFYLPFPIGAICSILQLINVNLKRMFGNK
ncbi:MAG: TRAP transporter small permease [Dorea sp.]|nr:TRAP transporter small permease [Dorea sp.]